MGEPPVADNYLEQTDMMLCGSRGVDAGSTKQPRGGVSRDFAQQRGTI